MKRNISKECDVVVMAAVFIIAAIYIIQYFVIKIGCNIHPQRLYQLFTSLEIFILSGCLLWKAYRLGACVATKVATWMYLLIVLTSLIYLIYPFGYHNLLIVLILISSIGIFILCATFFFKLWLKKLLHRRMSK